MSKALLISSATVIVRAGGAICLNPFATVLLSMCSAVMFVDAVFGDAIDDHMDGSKRVQPTRGWTVAAQRSTNCTHSSCPPQWGPV